MILTILSAVYTLFVYSLICTAVARFAEKHGLKAGRHFALAFFLSPMVGWLMVYIQGERAKGVRFEIVPLVYFKKYSIFIV